MKMKVTVLNGSPLLDKGNTSVILSPFLDGLKECEAEIETFYTAKLNIHHCTGCFTCWIKTPGRCVFRDDMDMVLESIKKADLLVLAAPVYVDGFPGTLKNVLDRSIPLALPFFEVMDGHCRHPLRDEVKGNGKMVLVSNCGYWEMDNFDPMVEHTKAICKNIHREFVGKLLRPHGPALRAMLEKGFPVQDVIEAAREAGKAVCRLGYIPKELEERVSRPLLPKDKYVEITNRYFEERIREASGEA